MKVYTTYIFDLDGTLTDTLVVWLGIFRDLLIEFDVAPPSDKVLSKHTHNWRQMLELGLPEEKLEAFIARAHILANSRLPEASLHVCTYDMLKVLKRSNKRIAIFSTMDRPIFEPAIEHHKLGTFAEVMVAGTDVEHRKPHPDGIIKVLDDLGISEDGYGDVVYIGDKDTDILAAVNAGVDGVLYYPPTHQEFYDENDLKQHHPAYILTDWQELINSLDIK